jgi:hypothetical protein
MFLKGEGRFRVMWDSGTIVNGFGHYSGFSVESIQHIIQQPTLKG